ncbi:response regulator receiver domain [Puniceicoccaceae bacterium K14]|nr:response regulator receiver domain [Puniceicoccaceae bacterium K14]
MSELNKFVQKAAADYLQSVVFVDDEIYNGNSGKPFNGEISIEGIGAGLITQFEDDNETHLTEGNPKTGNIISETTATDSPVNISPDYHPRELMESFAHMGITCALYEPREGYETGPTSDLFRLCERADVVILDWDVHDDDGDSASDLLTELIEKSQNDIPHQVRLCVIYTLRPRLHAILDSLLSKLETRGCIVTVIEGKLKLISGSTRISIFGKPQAAGRSPAESAYEVKESDLAKQIVAEFSEMHNGLLPGYTLHGLASIRRNSKRILDRFHANLDGAFLFHRHLVEYSEEAFDQLPELLSDEIRAVVEDERISISKTKLLAADTLRKGHIEPSDKDLIEQLNNNTKPKNAVKKLKSAENVPTGHLNLAALFSSRTQYTSASRQLRFGTVVKHRIKRSRSFNYAICLVPDCDSLRLKGPQVEFPFWTLDDEKFKNGPNRNGVILEIEKEMHVILSASGKAGEKLWTESFDIDKNTKTVVAHKNNKTYKYSGCVKTVEWIGQLKPLHAHRIARSITQGLSRVGVSEAEWVRLVCEKS